MIDVTAQVSPTMHIGRRDHYRLAAEMLSRGPERVVLMQRSSSLILGAESGWDDEAEFLDAALASIRGGATWHHIASTQGIAEHLRRRTSEFPHRHTARDRLIDAGGDVAIGTGVAGASPVADLPTAGGADFKLDRQARVLGVEFDDGCEAVVVCDIGDRQCSIHHCGPLARELVDLCIEFWATCPPLTWQQLDSVVAAAEATPVP